MYGRLLSARCYCTYVSTTECPPFLCFVFFSPSSRDYTELQYISDIDFLGNRFYRIFLPLAEQLHTILHLFNYVWFLKGMTYIKDRIYNILMSKNNQTPYIIPDLSKLREICNFTQTVYFIWSPVRKSQKL